MKDTAGEKMVQTSLYVKLILVCQLFVIIFDVIRPL